MELSVRKLWAAVLVAVLVTGCGGSAGSSTGLADRPEAFSEGKGGLPIRSLKEFAATADIVAIGTVGSMAPGRVEGAPGEWDTIRNVGFTVLETIKGEMPIGSAISVEQGFWTSDGQGVIVQGQPWSDEGDEVLFFLTRVVAVDYSGVRDGVAFEPSTVNVWQATNGNGTISLSKPNKTSAEMAEMLGGTQPDGGVDAVRIAVADAKQQGTPPITSPEALSPDGVSDATKIAEGQDDAGGWQMFLDVYVNAVCMRIQRDGAPRVQTPISRGDLCLAKTEVDSLVQEVGFGMTTFNPAGLLRAWPVGDKSAPAEALKVNGLSVVVVFEPSSEVAS